MAIPVIMPRQGQSVESCIISKWHKKKGDTVKTGDLLFSYETDKAAFDEEAKTDGTILDIFFSEGDDVPVLTNICVIGNIGENTAEFRPDGATPAAGDAASVPVCDPGADTQDKPSAAVLNTQMHTPPVLSDELKISPRARSLADKTGIDFRFASPTGPNGRIIERDINTLRDSGPLFTQAAKADAAAFGGQTGTGLGGRITTSDLASSPAAVKPAASAAPIASAAPAAPATGTTGSQPEYEEVKLSNIRKVIAKAMHTSLATTAQLTLNASFDATEILEYRKRLKDGKDKLGLANITINDIILYAVSRTLIYHKNLNANYFEDKMLLYKNVHLGCAVDTERGLMVPTIFNANLKTLNEIAKEVKKLAEECQKGTISPDLLKGGTFTVTNLGALGIESFTPVINPPQTGILGVNTTVTKVKEVNGSYVHYPSMTLSLTFNHMAIDGAPAARFLQDLKNNLENFSLLLSK